MSTDENTLLAFGERYLYQNYRQAPMVLSHGKGVEVWDTSGKRYLDMTAGVAVNALGHAHPAWVGAVSDQAGRLAHVSNYFFNEPNLHLAKRVVEATGMTRVLFCNSGTEAIEACLKLVRRHFHDNGAPERTRIIAFDKAFHGRTMGALAATGQATYRDGFGPLGPVTHVPFGDLDAVRAAISGDVAAVLVEPVQGEGGVVPAPAGFLAGLRALCDQRGVLLIADEIQTGVGRTGRFLAMEHSGVKADAVALAKGLGGGFPIGAMLCQAHLANALPPGSHGTTFGGNPLASAAALAVLDTLDKEHLLQRAQASGEHLNGRLMGLMKKYPQKLVATRGLGLLQALETANTVDTRALVGLLREEGLLVTIAGGQALRFSPPLVVTREQLDEAVAIVDKVVGGLS
ncbi:MAG: Acetylornithine aminotransferase [Pseudomonadota bacterium]|jgi:acetylornithine/N-succinyldiaminopimelate aminotransferase